MAAALLASSHRAQWPAFYQAFGHRRHVDRLRDNSLNLSATLNELGLPLTMAAAADDACWDDDLRARTRAATATLGINGGTPLIRLKDSTFFGPVLDRIPRGAGAVALWEAVRVLAASRAFAEIKRRRAETLGTA